jgi:hypothetical protein
MEKKVLALLSVSAFLLAAGAPTAHAYLDPCEVFGGCDEPSHGAAPEDPQVEEEFVDRTDLTSTAAPSLARDAEEAVALQQARAAAARDSAYRDLLEPETEETHAAAEDTSPSLGLLTENNDETEYNLRMQRMAESDKGNVTIVINGDGSVAQNGTVLHSGAPYVTATGPESALMLSLLILAGASTLAYVKVRNKRLA